MSRRSDAEKAREQMERQVRTQIALIKDMFENIDVEALDLSNNGSDGPAATLTCFGSVGTFGSMTGCCGTAGTFGCAGIAEADIEIGKR